MKPRAAAAMFAVLSIAVMALISCCSKQPSTSPSLGGLVGTPGSGSNDSLPPGPGPGPGPGDSVPPPPPPPPPPAPIVPIAFAGSDSALPGVTAHLNWVVGNE